MDGMEINADRDITSIDVVKKAMENGLLLVPAGPKVVRFVPPLIVSEEDVDQAADILDKSISQLID